MKVKIWVMSILSTFVGLMIAWIDRPNWDDAGITAALIFCATMSFGFFSPRSVWHWAVLTGVWIPTFNILFHHQYASIIILLIAFIGAYAGAALRKIFSSVNASSTETNVIRMK